MIDYYTCDEVFDRGGTHQCCILTGKEVDALPSDPARCHTHSQLVGQRRPLRAWSKEEARRKLTKLK